MRDKGSVVITGASKGIGEACALRLDKAGFHVFAGVRRGSDGERLRRIASSRLTPLLLDITDTASIEAAVATVQASTAGAGLAGLVNNAGIAVAGPLEYLPLNELRRQLEVNVVAQLAVTQAFLPLLRPSRGRIVFMSSIGGISTAPMIGAYNASKFALEAIADVLRLELLPSGIFVAAIQPGTIATPIWETSRSAAGTIRAGLPPEATERYGFMMRAAEAWAAIATRKGLPPDAVARAVEHALTAPKPKTRYLVGRDARIRALLTWLPDRLVDRLILSQFRRLGRDRHLPHVNGN